MQDSLNFTNLLKGGHGWKIMMMNDTNVSVTITACSFTGKAPCKYLDKTDNESSLISTELLLVIVAVVLVGG